MGESLQGYLAQGPAFVDAVVCYIVRGGKVLLGVRKKTSTGLGRGKIAGIGGKLEEGETVEAALVREVQEETGLTLEAWEGRGEVRFIWTHNPAWNMKVSVFVANKWIGEPTESPDIRPNWYGLSELPLEEMWEDNSYWVTPVLEGKTVIAAFLLGKDSEVIDYGMETIQP